MWHHCLQALQHFSFCLPFSTTKGVLISCYISFHVSAVNIQHSKRDHHTWAGKHREHENIYTSEQDLDQEDILGHATLFMFGWNSASPRIIFFHADLGRTSPHFFPLQGKSGSPSWDQHGGNATFQPAAWGQRRWLKKNGSLAKNLKIFSKVFIPRAETHCPRHSTKTRQSLRSVCSQPKS